MDRELTGRERALVGALVALIVVLFVARTLVQAPPTGEAVPWADYPADLRPRIEALVAARDCDGLLRERLAADRDSRATIERTGHDNGRLSAYIADEMSILACSS